MRTISGIFFVGIFCFLMSFLIVSKYLTIFGLVCMSIAVVASIIHENAKKGE